MAIRGTHSRPRPHSRGLGVRCHPPQPLVRGRAGDAKASHMDAQKRQKQAHRETRDYHAT
eukprot:scaffold31284_cov108-Isochrysis_galbana.AAC.4